MGPRCAIRRLCTTRSKTAAESASPEHLLSALPEGRAVLTGAQTMALTQRDGDNVRAMSASSLQIAVTHLNVPVGPVLTVDDFARALRAGSVAGFEDKIAALLIHAFVELDPALIARCAAEAGSDLR